MRRLVATLALGVLACTPDVAQACAPAPPEGAWVELVGERVLVAWDAASKREHLVLAPAFEGDADAFGYLIPTPSRPTVTSADDHVFHRLDQHLIPEVVVRTEGFEIIPSLFALALVGGADSAQPELVVAGVSVLSQEQVGSYDVTLLQATDADGLQAWLLEHGFHAPDPVRAWTEPYLGGDHVFTALRIASGIGEQVQDSASPAAPGAQGETTRRVRKSEVHPLVLAFDTDRPYAPFSGPDWSQHDQQPRTAPDKHFYLVSDSRLEGLEGETRRFGPGQVQFADRVSLGHIWDALDGVEGPAQGYLTIAALYGVPGVVHTDDLWFEPVPDGESVRPPPIIRTVKRTVVLPLVELAPVALLLGLALWWRRRQRRRD